MAPSHLEDAGREKTVTILDGLPVHRSAKVDLSATAENACNTLFVVFFHCTHAGGVFGEHEALCHDD